jgi:hypothetical protein
MGCEVWCVQGTRGCVRGALLGVALRTCFGVITACAHPPPPPPTPPPFTHTTYDNPMFRYQWRRGSANIAGATGSTYSFTTATSDVGTVSYSCLVTNQVRNWHTAHTGTHHSPRSLLLPHKPNHTK